MRPSQGRVPFWPAQAPEVVSQLGTDGPMARTVRDLAALLQTQAGHDPRTPLSINDGRSTSCRRADAALRAACAWAGWATCSGHLAMEDGLLAVCEEALARLAAHGAIVEPTALGFDPTRCGRPGWCGAARWWAPRWRRLLKQPGATRADQARSAVGARPGPRLGFLDFMAASEVRTAFYQHLLGLFERFDVLALPATQVWPFPIGQRWPRSIAGRTMDTYHRWMEVTLYATFAGLPAISVPAGFHANGRWPAGLQLIGRPQGDAALLRAAAGYEAASAPQLARRPAEPA
jgi:amidase